MRATIANCMNCEKPKTQMWEGVPVCDDCHKVATHILAKSARQMQLMLSVQKEAVRSRLVEGKLVLGVGGADEQDKQESRLSGGGVRKSHDHRGGPEAEAEEA